MNENAAVAVIGGGFYGARIALALAALRLGRVVLLERGSGLMRRASFANQARLHNGYHYPRAPRTGAAARRNFGRFLQEYRFAIGTEVPMVYAIARQSRISADQFVRFCEGIGAPCRPAGPLEAKLFDPNAVEALFSVEEYSFDARLIAQDLAMRLSRAGVDCSFGASVRVAGITQRSVTLEAGANRITASHVVNCTYAALDGIGVRLGSAVKKEMAEIALIRPPPALASLAVTVMDGPFFSTMPFPAMGCHSLTHVRYTPHGACTAQGPAPAPGPSRSVLMLRDAARFLPAMEAAVPLRSLFEVKAVLSATEDDDARPILLEVSPDSPRVLSVLGSKFDNVYDVERVLTAWDWGA